MMGCTITSGSNNLNVDPQIDANLTGDKLVHMLLAGSPAINAGNLSGCPPTDQLSTVRPQGSSCDIGSIEYIEATGPTVVSIVLADTNPTSAAYVNFDVTFSESVTGVDETDFSLISTGIIGASVTSVSGSGSTYTVTVDTGSGNGTLRLDLVSDGTIVDISGNPLTGDFTGGEVYTVNKTNEYTLTVISEHGTVIKNPDQATYQEGDVVQLTATPNLGWVFMNWSGDLNTNINPVTMTIQGNTIITANYTDSFTLTFDSDASNDGWVLESTEDSNTGKRTKPKATTLNVGDDQGNKQYISILHFDTSSLPDMAVITSVTLRIKKQGLVGTDPFTTHGDLLVDIKMPYFGTTEQLAGDDFQAIPGQSGTAIFDNIPDSNLWYSAVLSEAGYPYINSGGTTQFRLRYALDDNNDQDADYVKFYSGDANEDERPKLIVQYYIP